MGLAHEAVVAWKGGKHSWSKGPLGTQPLSCEQGSRTQSWPKSQQSVIARARANLCAKTRTLTTA